MKRIIKAAMPLFIFLIFTFSSHAQEDFGQDELMDALPEGARDMLYGSGITPDNAGALNLSPFAVIRGLWDLFIQELTQPLRMLAALVGVILLCAVAETLRDSAGGDNPNRASDAFAVVGVLAGAGLMIMYVSDIVVRATGALNAGGTFLLTFVPVFAGIMAVTGQLTTASVFSVSLITAGQVFTYITSAFLTPLTSCILGISAAGAVNPDLKADALAEMIKKLVIWTLGLLVTLFTGLLSLQSFISSSADTVAMRAMKFTVSSSVPFVGGAVSDALAAVRGSINLVRNSTGTFGIIAGIAIIAPTLVSVFCHKIALGIAAAVSGVFGLRQLSSLLKSGESVMGIIFALLFCFTLIVIISVGFMLMIWNGGV
ncbi:MAG: stage III sporulation protein AE [Oscillospiraceae bacterium]|jgi:stage III sporulation protein AE|nr:stage III sporulation protein AE [Oscillospiraceae bacterium]